MAKPDSKKKKIKGFKEFDGSKYINTEPVLDEAKAGTVVIAWGRMNPMTAGHEMLVKKVIDVAKTEKGTPQIYLSHSQGAKTKTGKGSVNKDPLAYDDKIKFAQKAFGPIVKKSPAKTIMQLFKILDKQFDRVVLVVGSDRVKEFTNRLNMYNGKEYKFSEIKIVSAGQRDEDADDVSGISGTKMREYAKTDMKKFTANLPKKLKGDAEKIAALVNKGTQMTEESNLDEALTRQQRRKRGLAMKKARFKIARGREKAKRKTASMEVLKKRARKAAINILKTKFSKARRYADMSAGEKEVIDKRIEKVSKQRLDAIAKKLLPKVKTAERERRMNLMKGGSSTNEEINEGMWGQRISKKPHMLMDKNNKVKFDKRFKMYKPKMQEDFSLNDISDLASSTEEFIAEDTDMIKFNQFIDEAATPQMKKAAASIEAYAKKSGGIDKADFMKAAKMLSSGNAGSNFIKFVDDLDTEPREWLITNLAKTMGKQTVEKMFKVKIREEVELDEAEMSLYDKIKAARANPSPDKPARGRGSKNRNPKTYDPRKALDKEDDRLQGMVKKKLKKEEFELDEDLTHQTVKPPNHTKKFSGKDSRDTQDTSANEWDAPGNKRHTVTSSQADAHDKTAAHHNEVADAHTKAGEKSSSPTLQRLHHQASVHHKKAAEAHFNASHSSSGADKDGSIQKKAKDLHMAYHLTMHANKMSQEVRNKGSKAKRILEEVEELDEDAKMKKQSDDNLKSLHKQFKGQDQKMPSTQHMMKRITKEMKRRNMGESEEAAKLASVANGGVQDKEDKFRNALNRVRNKKSMKDESSCGSSKKRNEEAGAGEEGTAKLVKRLKKDTPNA